MKLIVGLGNPGRDYVGSRHNVGFEAVDRFACRLGWIGQPGDFDRQGRSRFDGLALDGLATFPGASSAASAEKTLLLKPATFMNDSGRSVQAAMAFYQLEPAEVMVVLDDLALPCGKLRIRAAGSDGGHNGLRDIDRALGTTKYPRLRLGIDPTPPRQAGRDYVLGRFTEAQRVALEPALVRAAEALGVWIERGAAAAMNLFNAGDAPAGAGASAGPRRRSSDDDDKQ